MSDKAKLLFIVPTLHQGGQERVTVRSAYLLADKYDITIAVFDDSDIGYDVEGLDIVNLNVPSARFKLFKLINVIRRSVKLKNLKKKLNPVISYSQGGTAGIANCLSSSAGGATWVSIRSYLDVTYSAISRLYKRRADLIVCCSKDIENELESRYGITKTATMYNLYDVDAIIRDSEDTSVSVDLPGSDSSGRKLRYIMAMGRDDDHKMFWHMIKAFKLINIVIPDTRLVILGAGEYTAYKRMVKGLGLEEEIIFAGMQKNPFAYLKHGEIIWMTSRIEGFPNALVEGMALGLVPVSTNCPSGPAEILIEGGSTYECAEKFEQMEENPGLWAMYGEYGILTPALSYERDMDFAHITPELFNLAEVMVELLRDNGLINKYSKAASDRVRDFGYDRYHERFDELAKEYITTKES